MELRTRAVEAIVLWPPGPQRREANGAAARVFALSGDPGALALPDCLVLTVGTLREGTGTMLRETWEGIEGFFACDHVERRGDCLYLPVEGPLAVLESRVREFFREGPSLPFEPAIGFYMGKMGEIGDTDTGALAGIVESRFRWHSCSLALLYLEGDLDGLRLLRWRERATSWRPSPRGKRPDRVKGPKAQ